MRFPIGGRFRYSPKGSAPLLLALVILGTVYFLADDAHSPLVYVRSQLAAMNLSGTASGEAGVTVGDKGTTKEGTDEVVTKTGEVKTKEGDKCNAAAFKAADTKCKSSGGKDATACGQVKTCQSKTAAKGGKYKFDGPPGTGTTFECDKAVTRCGPSGALP